MHLQEFDVTVVCKSGRKHSDASCLSRAAVNLPPPDSGADDDFFDIMTETDLAAQQHANPDLRDMIDYLEGPTIATLRAFKRNFRLSNATT